jgi:DNA gyrase subunit A
MNLRGGDRLVSMDVLPAELADRVAEGSDDEEGDSEEVISDEGPWVLVASASGLGKRVPVRQFRLQKRAGMGLRAIRFRREGDVLIGLKVLGSGEELLLVSEKGVIVRMQADAVPQQSRAATGVRLQRLDAGDRLAEVVLVPPAAAGLESTGPLLAEDSGAEPDGVNGGADPETEPTSRPETTATAKATAKTEAALEAGAETAPETTATQELETTPEAEAEAEAEADAEADEAGD